MKYATSTLVDLAVECGSSCVFRCVRVRLIVQELCTHIEAVHERTRWCKNVNNRTGPCVIRTWTVSVVWRSYKTVCALRVLDEGLGNGRVRFHTPGTAFTDTLEWPMCNSDLATVGSVVCTDYTSGQPCKPCVLCENTDACSNRLISD